MRRGPIGMAMVLSAAFAGCGGASAHDVLAQAGASLSRVRSGNMDLRMVVSGGNTAGGQVGFEERGPFALPDAGALPVAQTELTHFAGSQRDSSTFISTGQKVYVGSGGQTYALPPARVEQLRRASTPQGTGSLGDLRVDRWARGGTESDGGTVDGVTSDHVNAQVNATSFMNDLMQLARGLGQAGSLPQLSSADTQQLNAAVHASSFDLWAGRDDHLIRRLRVSMDFAVPAADSSGALAAYSRSHLELDLDLTGVNEPVKVGDPPGAQPFASLCARQPEAATCKNGG